MKKEIIDSYNTKDTLLVISVYPKQGEVYSTATSGVASYTKNLISHLNKKVIVLADYNDKPQLYEETNKRVIIRCFKSNSPLLWFQLLRTLKQFNLVKNILIQFDLVIYGGVFSSSLIVPFLLILKLFNSKVSLVTHHVVLQVGKLWGHVGLDRSIKGKIKGLFYTMLIRFFYILIGRVTDQVIVLEEKLKEKLNPYISSSQVIAIPHGVDTSLISTKKSKARDMLGIKNHECVLLFFGFVNWFKGADFFVKAFSSRDTLSGKKIRCIVAGGISPTLKNKSHYQRYFQSVLQDIRMSVNVEITGYIPLEKIHLYFSACDLVVFPYRHFMTASGVLSLVFSYKKPFIISSELSEMFDASDFAYALSASRLDKNDFMFDITPASCVSQAEKVLKNGIKRKMLRFNRIIRKTRSYSNTAMQYEKAIFSGTDHD